MFKKIWKMHKKSILGSLVVVFGIVVLIYTSSISGRFIWLDTSITGYAVTPGFSITAIFISLLTLLILFILFYRKSV